MAAIMDTITGRRPERPDLDRRWQVTDLDSELRYMPVVEALPQLPLPICEVGSGPRGLAAWTPREIIGVDPGDDDRHAGIALESPPNLHRVAGDGKQIPLEDCSVGAAVAVDTVEHVPRADRPLVITEMQRITASGGRVILIGPTGPEAEAADRRLLARFRERGLTSGSAAWLTEHVEYGLPKLEELVGMLAAGRTTRITARGVFKLSLWWTMHRVALGDFPRARGAHVVHHLEWAPFGFVARRLHRGPFYRYIVVAHIT